jgi:DNA-binding NarL/FixJ family response regulator
LDTSKTNIRTLIVDDHPIVRYGLKHILAAEDGIEVVGELDSVLGIEKILTELQPDIVILDLELGDTHGVDALRQFREVAPDMHVIIYTTHDEEDRIIQVAELGVNGYLLKGCAKKEIVDAIRNVHDGGTALEASVATKLLNRMNKRSNRNEPFVQLSVRETQVLELLATGKSNRDIGTTLFISESTVKFHVHAILGKLDAGNRTEAVSIAAQHRIINLTESGG